MQSLETLQQNLNTKEKEIADLKKEIDQARHEDWQQDREKRRRQAEEKYGDVIQKINEHIAAAAQSMATAIALGKETGITSFTGGYSSPRHEAEGIDLDTISDLIHLNLITDQLYEAGIENISW